MTSSSPTGPAVLSEAFESHSGVFLDGPAGQFTFEQIAEDAARIGSWLKNRRIERGDTVAVAMMNSPQAVIVWIGLLREGVSIVPLNPSLPDEEITYILRMAEVKLVFADSFTKEKADRWVEEVGSRCETVSAENRPWSSYSLAGRAYVDPDDIAVIFFTSGTTGRPKGAMLTHRALLANAEGCRLTFQLDHTAAFACPIPIFHSFAATVCLFLPALVGGRCFLHSPTDIPGFLAAIPSLDSPRILVAVPSILNFISGALDKLNPFIRFIVSGGAALPRSARQRLEEGGATVYEGYGTTECGPVISSQCPNAPNTAGSVGRPIHGVEVQIRSSEGNALPEGETGEIVARTPALMAGYYDLAQATEASLKGGWFHTGDLGYLAESGELFIVDRLTDAITVKGITVLPQSVENVLLSHEAIEEAAVVGIPDGAGSEMPWAFARKAEGAGDASPSAILQYCRDHLPVYAVPRGLEFRDTLPKTITGKILKRTLRQKWL